VAPRTSNPKAEGSGTGWKASPQAPPSNPEAKVLCVPSGVILVMVPAVRSDTNRSPALLKASMPERDRSPVAAQGAI
jgi:hypothetical protein